MSAAGVTWRKSVAAGLVMDQTSVGGVAWRGRRWPTGSRHSRCRALWPSSGLDVGRGGDGEQWDRREGVEHGLGRSPL
eukprot:2760023-Rhodomonas_salina.1